MLKVIKCLTCKKLQPETNFFMSDKSPGVRIKNCTDCHRTVKNVIYPSSWTIKSHGLTGDQYEEMLNAQGRSCAICKTSMKNVGRALFIDHDHSCCPKATSCGKCVRGLLCRECNYGLGVFKDSPGRLKNAAAYLEGTS